MTLDQIMTPEITASFLATGEISQATHDRLFEYYCAGGEMPYGTMKARTGDPYLWILDRLAQDVAERRAV